MGKILVLAEKPSVGRDIARALGVRGSGEGLIENEQYIISWAIGHLVSLCEPDELKAEWKKWSMDTLPMLPEALNTKVLPKTAKQFRVVKQLMNRADVEKVICATDSGREGELIFRYIYAQTGCRKPVERLWISSMTDTAIKDGFAALRPSAEYDGLYDSARCRSEADWLIGMNASRAYTLKYDALLSIGRVQTPTLKIIVERDREIRNFVPKDYWEIRASFGDYEGLWVDPKTGEMRCTDAQKAKQIASQVQKKTARVMEYVREQKKMPVPLLYDLTTLQRDANKQLGLSAAQTLKIAQTLYEKHKIITYPRTDSQYLTHDMTAKVKKALQSLTGEPCHTLVQPLLEKPLSQSRRIYNDEKVSDHHAIIPTGKSIPASLNAQEAGVFDLIARRLTAIHYPDYRYEAVRVMTECEGQLFKSTGTHPVDAGWKAVYADRPGKKDEETLIPELKAGEERTVRSAKVKACKTKPPEVHTDASLLAAMEHAGKTLEDDELRDSLKDSGLGTPATRAAMIERLIEVGYVQRKGKSIVSTEKGEKLVDVAHEQLTSAELTGRWEKALEMMAREKDPQKREQQITRFMEGIRRYAAFLVEQVKNAESGVQFDQEERVHRKGKRTKVINTIGVDCPVCGKGKITENERAFGCSRWKQGCKMTVWKDCLEKYGGPIITAKLMKLMIEKGDVKGSTGVIYYRAGEMPRFEKQG